MFQQAIQALCANIKGVEGAAIMGLDGIAIEKYGSPEMTDLEVFIAETAGLFKQASTTGEAIQIEGLDEMVLCSSRRQILFRRITSEYIIVLALKKNGYLGRARHELLKASHQLSGELTI